MSKNFFSKETEPKETETAPACGEVNTQGKVKTVCKLPRGHANDHFSLTDQSGRDVPGGFFWSGFEPKTKLDADGNRVPSAYGEGSGCGHTNMQYYTGSEKSRERVEVVCELASGHPGDHFALVDANGDDVTNGYWGNDAGKPVGRV